ncbi:MAG: amidase [Chloroflexi bacterium]|nr:MAG: amidase [Chloroflexota bacterium]
MTSRSLKTPLVAALTWPLPVGRSPLHVTCACRTAAMAAAPEGGVSAPMLPAVILSARVDLDEVTIDQLQAHMAAGTLSARELVEAYLLRIEAIDRTGPTLRSIIEINPDALAIADALDRERANGHVRGQLHGIPIVIKDNIDTADRMQTTAGSLALAGSYAGADAPVAARLRQAGAILLAKANLSEWANFRSTRSSSGWSGRGRQTRNPFVLDRSPGGSSSGSAVAVSANLCVAALGTETDGSIMSPSSASGVVGIKPTVGLTSRQGVVPISHTQDTVGPHARTVADAAAVLSAVAESGEDYRQYLQADALSGARIGIARKFHTEYSEHTDRVFDQALEVLRQRGVELIDDVEIPAHAQLRADLEGADVTAERLVLQYEFKAGIAAYLATRPGAEMCTLADLIHFNVEHADQEMPYFGQEVFLQSEARGPLTDELYQRALDHEMRFARGFAQLFEERGFAALVAPTNAPAWAIDVLDGDRGLGGSAQAAAVSGFPLITVPAGFALGLLPLGLTFMGPPRSEPTLIKLAFAFEQASPVRRVPGFRPSTLDLP